MASSGAFSDSTHNIKISVEWKTLSRDLVNNKTKIRVKAYLTPTKGKIVTLDPRDCVISVDGSKVKYTKDFNTVQANTKVKFAEREATITHETNGTCSFVLSATCDINLRSYNGYKIPTATGSGTVTLDVINRLSPTITNFSITSTTKNSVTFRADGAHAYGIDQLQYKLAGPSETISAKSWVTAPSSKIITGLTQATTYQLQVRFRAGNGLFVKSELLTFETAYENQDPPVFVKLNATALSDNTISVVSEFTQSAGLPVTKLVSINGGSSYPYAEGKIATLTHDTTYSIKVKATASNGQVAYSDVQSVTTLDAMDSKRQYYGVYGKGLIWKNIDGVKTINPDYL